MAGDMDLDGEQATLGEYADGDDGGDGDAGGGTLSASDVDPEVVAEAVAAELADVVASPPPEALAESLAVAIKNSPGRERMRERIAELEGEYVDLEARVEELEESVGDGGRAAGAPSRGFQ